jgi:hypothetical protein
LKKRFKNPRKNWLGWSKHDSVPTIGEKSDHSCMPSTSARDAASRLSTVNRAHAIQECDKIIEQCERDIAALVVSRAEGMPAHLYEERLKEAQGVRQSASIIRLACIKEMMTKVLGE